MCSCDEGTSELIRHKARRLTRHPAFSDSDQEDIEQELQLHLMQKLPMYDPARGKLSTYAARVIRNKIASMVRFHTAQKRDYRRNGAWPDGALGDSAQIKHLQGRSESEQASLKSDVAQALQALSPTAAQVAEVLKHKSPTTVARQFNLSSSRMTQIMTQIRKRFEDEKLHEYLIFSVNH